MDSYSLTAPPQTSVYTPNQNTALLGMGQGGGTYFVRWTGGGASSATYDVLPDPGNTDIGAGMVKGRIHVMLMDTTDTVAATRSDSSAVAVLQEEGTNAGFVASAISSRGNINLTVSYNNTTVVNQQLDTGVDVWYFFEFPVSVGSHLIGYTGSSSDVLFFSGGSTDSAGVSASVHLSYKIEGLTGVTLSGGDGNPRALLWEAIPLDDELIEFELIEIWQQPYDECGGA